MHTEYTHNLPRTTHRAYLYAAFFTLFFIVCARSLSAQTDGKPLPDSVRSDLLYSMSGFGFAFPIGQTGDYFSPRFSTDLGLNIGLGKANWFLYPKVSLQAYRYDEQYAEQGFSTRIQAGRATTYLANIMLGYRATTGKVSYYGFAGGGGGLILTSQIRVSPDASEALMTNRNNWMPTIEAGGGIEYSLGDAVLFIEGSYLRGFRDIQGRTFNSVPVYVGIKPNLTKLIVRLREKMAHRR